MSGENRQDELRIKLRTYLEGKGWDAKWFAEQNGISHNTLYNWTGGRDVGYRSRLIDQIAKAMGESPKEFRQLAGFEEEQEGFDDETEEALRRIRAKLGKLPDDERVRTLR